LWGSFREISEAGGGAKIKKWGARKKREKEECRGGERKIGEAILNGRYR